MKTISIALLMLAGVALAQIPEGHTVNEDTISPDGKYGIIATDLRFEGHAINAVVEVKSGKIVHQFDGEAYPHSFNHGSLHAAWSADGRFLLYTVEGKWFPNELRLLKLKRFGKVKELDLLAACQDEMLKRTKEQFPKEHELTKNRGGVGTAYPDGFTIGFRYERDGELVFPFTIGLSLTNDPKLLAGHDEEFTDRLLEGEMTATVQKRFKIKFDGFQMLGPAEALKARGDHE